MCCYYRKQYSNGGVFLLNALCGNHRTPIEIRRVCRYVAVIDAHGEGASGSTATIRRSELGADYASFCGAHNESTGVANGGIRANVFQHQNRSAYFLT